MNTLLKAADLVVGFQSARIRRLNMVLKHNVPTYALKADHLLRNKPVMVKAVEDAICSGNGGVQILCAPPGAGKSTALDYIIGNLIKSNKISGWIRLTPPRSACDLPDRWFRTCNSDFLGETIKVHDTISSIVGKRDAPVVYIFDQFDNFEMQNPTQTFLKSMAEDSVRERNFVTVVAVSNPTKARIIWNWNGRQKINLLGVDHIMKYKWDESEILPWLENFKKHHPGTVLDDSVMYKKLLAAAKLAGTPEFLVSNTSDAVLQNLDELEEMWNRTSHFHMTQWEEADKILRWK